MIFARIWITATLAFAGLSGLSAAQNVGTVDGVARANVGTINGVPMANVGTINGVDNTPAGGITVENFLDDFNRADNSNISTGAPYAWTEHTGDFRVVSNTVRNLTTGFVKVFAWVSGRSITGPDGHAGITLSSVTAFPEIAFRVSDGSSAYLAVHFRVADNVVQLRYYTDGNASATTIQAINTVVDSGDRWHITWSGSGNDLTVRAWRNPSADTPSAIDLMDGVGPTVTFTDDPPAAVDSGNYVGLVSYGNGSTTVILDDFRFGGIY